MNFIPDSGKYEIVSYICTCTNGHASTNTPLRRIAVEVAGWAQHGETPSAMERRDVRKRLPLHPVILEPDGLRVYPIAHDEATTRIGAPRLAPIGQAQMTHQELILMHRTLHGQD